MPDLVKAKELIYEFDKLVLDIVSIYLDTQACYLIAAQKFNAGLLDINIETHQTMEELYKLPLKHTFGDESQNIIPVGTIGEFMARISEPGKNMNFIANMNICSIYQFWEDHYRGEIAESLGIDKNELKSDIFGDLRLLRNSIIHHKGIAKSDIKNSKIILKFEQGDQIKLERDDFWMIYNNIFEYLKFLIQEYLPNEKDRGLVSFLKKIFSK